MKPSQNTQVRHNKKVHDAAASSYERNHTEIYNPTEQARIANVLEDAISRIATLAEGPLILDFGAGTGNLTGHLLRLGARVVAADVSKKSLVALTEKFAGTNRLEIVELNGIDLSTFDNNSLDMVATYSVLHHVPDYLGAVKEFVRVVKPGGIIYIDHECAPCVWQEGNRSYENYMMEYRSVYGRSLSQKVVSKIMNLFSFSAWRRLVNRKLFGLSEEGDIHVTKDDHIEWDLIEDIFRAQCDLVIRRDYLVCREVSLRAPLHSRYADVCADMRVIVVKKR